MANQKLSQEELQELNQIQKQNDNITYSLGQVEVQKAILEGQKTSLLEELAKLQEKQNSIAKKLQEKYGDGNINLDSGEFVETK